MSSITQALNQANNEFNSALSKQKGSNMDKDSFMLLLVTQFKYQDPLNPMEDKEFIAQLAQFSSLEQLMNLNTSMEGLTDATNNQQMINATSYIGKTSPFPAMPSARTLTRRPRKSLFPSSVTLPTTTWWRAARSLCATPTTTRSMWRS